MSIRDSLLIQRHKQVESERIEKYIHANSNQKRAGVAILISDKMDFKSETVTTDKEKHYILIKDLIQLLPTVHRFIFKLHSDL